MKWYPGKAVVSCISSGRVNDQFGQYLTKSKNYKKWFRFKFSKDCFVLYLHQYIKNTKQSNMKFILPSFFKLKPILKPVDLPHGDN